MSGDRPDIEEFIGYARRGFEPRPFVQAGEINEEDWKNTRPGSLSFVPDETTPQGDADK